MRSSRRRAARYRSATSQAARTVARSVVVTAATLCDARPPPLAGKNGVEVLVVERAVAVPVRLQQRPLEPEPGSPGDAARRRVVDRVVEVLPAQAEIVEGVPHGGAQRSGGDAAPAGPRRHPVAGLRVALVGVNVAQ